MTSVETAPPIENPIDRMEAEVCGNNEFVKDVVGFVAGDYINLAARTWDVVVDAPHILPDALKGFSAGAAFILSKMKGDDKGAAQAASEFMKHGSSMAKVGAVLGAAAMVGLRYVNFGKLAKAATEKLGTSLGRSTAQKVFTEEFAGKLAEGAMDSVEKALAKNPNLSLEAINQIKNQTVEKMVEDKVASTVAKDLLPVLKTLGAEGKVTTDSIMKALVASGIENEEAKGLAKLLIKARIPMHMGNKASLAKMETILVKSITEGMNEGYNLQREAFEAAFVKRWGQLADEKFAPEMARKLKETALDGFDDAVRSGIKKGVKRGVHEAFEEYKKWKFRPRFHMDDEMFGAGRLPRTGVRKSYLDERQSVIAGWRYRNAADQWVERGPALTDAHRVHEGVSPVSLTPSRMEAALPKGPAHAGEKLTVAAGGADRSTGAAIGDAPKLEIQNGGIASGQTVSGPTSDRTIVVKAA